MLYLKLHERWGFEICTSEQQATSLSTQICSPALLPLNISCLGCYKELLYNILKSRRHRIMCSYMSYFRHRQQSIPKANLCLELSIKHNRVC